jgi:hypothetical protein
MTEALYVSNEEITQINTRRYQGKWLDEWTSE